MLLPATPTSPKTDALAPVLRHRCPSTGVPDPFCTIKEPFVRPYCTIWYYIVQYGMILYNMVPYCTIWYRIVQYGTILYNMVPYCII